MHRGRSLSVLSQNKPPVPLTSAFYGMTPGEYRAKWNLPADYPTTAPNYVAEMATTSLFDLGAINPADLRRGLDDAVGPSSRPSAPDTLAASARRRYTGGPLRFLYQSRVRKFCLDGLER